MELFDDRDFRKKIRAIDSKLGKFLEELVENGDQQQLIMIHGDNGDDFEGILFRLCSDYIKSLECYRLSDALKIIKKVSKKYSEIAGDLLDVSKTLNWNLYVDQQVKLLEMMILFNGKGDYSEEIREKIIAGISDSDAPGWISKFVEIALKYDDPQFRPLIREQLAHKSKKVRDVIVTVLGKYADVLEYAPEFLKHKSATMRESVVDLLLIKVKKDGVKELLQQHITGERSRKIVLKICKALKIDPPAEKTKSGKPKKELTFDEMVAAAVKKVRKKVKPWAIAEPFPEMKFKDGGAVSEDLIKYILLKQSNGGVLIEKEVKKLCKEISPDSMGTLAKKLADQMYHNFGDTKLKWSYGIITQYGDDSVAEMMGELVDILAKSSSGKRGEHIVISMVQMRSIEAMAALDRIYRSYNMKYTYLRTAARSSLDEIAFRMKINPDEIEDIIVPRVGFEPGKARILMIGERKIEVRITSEFKFNYYDIDKKKMLKSLPKGVAPEEKAAIKKDVAQLKKIVKYQTERIRRRCSTQSVLSVKSWLKYYVAHPVLKQFCERQIWMLLDGYQPVTTFIKTIEGFEDVHYDSVELPEDGNIVLAHPFYMSKEEIALWGEYLDDNEVVPLFLQLNHPVYQMDQRKGSRKNSPLFSGNKVNHSGLKKGLALYGWDVDYATDYWEPDPIDDATKIFERYGITAVVNFDNFYTHQYDYNSSDVEVKAFYFMKRGSGEKMLLKDVDPFVWSETVADLTRIAGVPEEKDGKS